MSLDRCSLNQATVKHADMPTAIAAAAAAGIPAIGVWRDRLAEYGLRRTRDAVRAAGLRVSSLCRGGRLTTAAEPDRRAALDDNLRAIEDAAELGAPVLVLVVGGLPSGSRDLEGARSRVGEALETLAPVAAASGVRLAIEPLHPMYAADRSVVCSLEHALELAAPHPPSVVGVAVDTFHLWWVTRLPDRLRDAADRIALYQVADWVTPIAGDALLSRGIPGDGHVDFAMFTRAVSGAGYTGDIECEVFRQEIWEADPGETARRVAAAHLALIAPSLT